MAKSKINSRTPSRRFLGGFWTNLTQIRWVVVFIILIWTGLILSIMYFYSLSVIKDSQNKLSADFISGLDVFQTDVALRNFDSLQYDVNNILQVNNGFEPYILYTVVTNTNKKQVYSNLPKQAKYIYTIKEKPNSFKIMNPAEASLTNTNVLYIPYFGYNIYFIVCKNDTTTKLIDEMRRNFIGFVWMLLFFAMCISFKFGKSISEPLSNIEKTVSKISGGDLSERIEYSRYLEVNKLVDAYNKMANALQRLYSTLEAQVASRTKELRGAYTELQNTQAMMVHSEKMKSLGELVAGIMHEINNPINFIYGNMTHLSNYSNDLINIIDEYSKYQGDLPQNEQTEIQNLKNEIDYEFLKTDMPDLIKSCKEGADRAKNIIQDLKSFSRMEEAAITDVDVAHEIDTTLNILHNKIKHKVEIHKEYTEPIPKIEAFGGQLNQVFMNILDNAVGAIKDKGDIYIRIKLNDSLNKLIIEFEDNGEGMDSETARKVFDPFFTTKPVGQGTGLGMSITHKIIKSHQGDIKVESKKGVGTKFTITLPLNLDRENITMGIVKKGE